MVNSKFDIFLYVIAGKKKVFWPVLNSDAIVVIHRKICKAYW